MMDRTTGWALGQIGMEQANRILRTLDGGATWRDVSPGSESYYSLFAPDAQLAWVHLPDNDEMWRTQDGGESWTSLGQIQGSEFWFHDDKYGWKMEADAWGLSYVQYDILSFSTTQDGGQTWQEAEPPPGNGLAFFASADPQTLWVIRAGFAKTIEGFPDLAVPFFLATTGDGGIFWQLQSMPLPENAEVVDMADGVSYLDVGNCSFDSPVYSSTSLWTMALTCEEGGWLYSSVDQGKTWTIHPLPAGYAADVEFIDPSVGWSLHRDAGNPYESRLYKTTDGGVTWTLLAHTPWAEAWLDFVDEQTGWSVAVTCDVPGCNPYLYPRALAKTIDGGRTWQALQPGLLP
jgi:photosystem II stability/assembly factor-like uncharacterized protein